MYLPDMTKLTNDIQRSIIPVEDRPVVCSAIQMYYKTMYEIGGTKAKYVADNISKETMVPKIVLDNLDKYNKEQLEAIATELMVTVDVEQTKQVIIKQILEEM